MQPLRTIYLPPPTGDDEVLRSRSQAGSLSDEGDFDDLSDSIDLMLPDEGENNGHLQHQDDPASDIDALPFPLYSLHAAKADALHKPCGTLPLVMYWGKRERPRVFNRQIGKGNKRVSLSLCVSLSVSLSLSLQPLSPPHPISTLISGRVCMNIDDFSQVTFLWIFQICRIHVPIRKCCINNTSTGIQKAECCLNNNLTAIQKTKSKRAVENREK